MRSLTRVKLELWNKTWCSDEEGEGGGVIISHFGGHLLQLLYENVPYPLGYFPAKYGKTASHAF